VAVDAGGVTMALVAVGVTEGVRVSITRFEEADAEGGNAEVAPVGAIEMVSVFDTLGRAALGASVPRSELGAAVGTENHDERPLGSMDQLVGIESVGLAATMELSALESTSKASPVGDTEGALGSEGVSILSGGLDSKGAVTVTIDVAMTAEKQSKRCRISMRTSRRRGGRRTRH